MGVPGIIGSQAFLWRTATEIAQQQNYYENLRRQHEESYAHACRQLGQNSLSQLGNALSGLGGAACGSGLGGVDWRGMYQEPRPMVDIEKQKKAENKAILLLQNMIGVQNCDIYRKSHVIGIRQKFLWLIGEVKTKRNEMPFYGKPDVARVDNEKKLHVTYFCVDQVGESTPYTDKVIAFACHLKKNEAEFIKTINRISEDTLEQLPEYAEF